MPYFKITDVRVRVTPATNQVHVLIDGMNTSDDLGLTTLASRAALLLAIFNARRDAFWDTGQRALVTDPHPTVTGVPSAANSGVVTGWEVRVPLTGNIDFQLDLVTAGPQPLASGNTAAAWATVNIPEQLAIVYLTVLLSKYARYDNGILRNADPILIP